MFGIKREVGLNGTPPKTGEYKLNIDGSARDNIITGGGVIRDDSDRVVAGFLTLYGIGTNTLAEFLALKEGLVLCSSLLFPRVQI